jgi:hypothetical protein
MITGIRNLLMSSNLHTRIKELEIENARLKQQLEGKQVQINKSNAYWKGVVRKMEKGKSTTR